MNRYLVTVVPDLFPAFGAPVREYVTCCITAPDRMSAWEILRRDLGPKPAFILTDACVSCGSADVQPHRCNNCSAYL